MSNSAFRDTEYRGRQTKAKNVLLPDFVVDLCFDLDLILCVQEDSLWACLAAMAAYAKELSTAEIAYAAIDEVRRSEDGGRKRERETYHLMVPRG